MKKPAQSIRVTVLSDTTISFWREDGREVSMPVWFATACAAMWEAERRIITKLTVRPKRKGGAR